MTALRTLPSRRATTLRAFAGIGFALVSFGAGVARAQDPEGLVSGDAAAGASYVTTAGTSHSDIVGRGADHAFGNSRRYLGDTHVGQASWFAFLDGGPAARVGLWDPTGAGTDEFTSPNGVQMSHAIVSAVVGDALFVAGNSRRYLGEAETSAAFGSAFGVAAWICNTATGETTRMGLVGDEFTKRSGETNGGLRLGARSSSVSALTASGFVQGYTVNYSPDTTGTGQALWVSRVDDLGACVRIGLHDPAGTPDEQLEYTEADRTQSAFPSIGPTESGYVAGTARRRAYTDDFGVGTPAGTAVWVASAVTGQTRRIGLVEGFEYTSNVGTVPNQVSNLYAIAGASGLLDAKARVLGYSQRYKDQAGANVGAATIQLGQAVWIADAATGATTRIGLWQGATYNQQTGTRAGTQHSAVTGVHSGADHVWGYSTRYTAAATSNASDNRIAWIYHVATGAQTVFELGASEASGLGFSVVVGMTAGGVAYGHYTTYAENSDTSAGDRAFLWSEALGARPLDELVGAQQLAAQGWAALTSITAAEEGGSGLLTLAGQAALVGGGAESYGLTIDIDGGSDPGSAEMAAFLDWLAARGLPATIASHDADPDGDGLPALLEFALGKPAAGTGGGGVAPRVEAIVVDVGGTLYPGIRYTCRRDIAVVGGVALAVEHAGGDLVFTSAVTLHPHATRDLGDGVDEVELRSSAPLAAVPRQFFRLRASLPE